MVLKVSKTVCLKYDPEHLKLNVYYELVVEYYEYRIVAEAATSSQACDYGRITYHRRHLAFRSS